MALCENKTLLIILFIKSAIDTREMAIGDTCVTMCVICDGYITNDSLIRDFTVENTMVTHVCHT